MKSRQLIFILLLLIATVGQVTSDMYLPSLSAIATTFSTDHNQAQLTVAFFMYGFAISQLVYGPVSDAVGRRRPLLIGLVICLIGGIICIWAPSIDMLILGRLLQGLGAGAGTTLSRAILRDTFTGSSFAKFASYLAVVGVVIMTSAPIIGGYIQQYIGWRYSFITLSIYAAVILGLVFCKLDETNQHQHRDNIKWQNILQSVKTLSQHATYWRFVVVILCTYAGIMAWATASPILLIDALGFKPVVFGWLAVLSGLSYMIGGITNGRVVERIGSEHMLFVGLLFMLVASLIMAGFALFGVINAWVIIAPIMIYTCGMGFTFANAFAGALSPFPKIAGLAGSVTGFMQIMGGAVGSTIMASTPTMTQLPLGLVLTIVSALSLLALVPVLRQSALNEN